MIQIRIKKPTPKESVTVRPARLRVRSRKQRVLDVDIENRPLSYLGSDFTTCEITAIAVAWVGDPTKRVWSRLLGEGIAGASTDVRYMLDFFVAAWNDADVVTGHYLRGHDLPIINGALMEHGMAPLSDKLVQDTKLDLMRTKGISLSQESLGAMRRLEASKVQMNQAKWRAANRLTKEGLAEVRKRVEGDVRQHMELRKELLALGYLGPAKMWRSGSAKTEAYVP